ncbi:MAG TPA: c-type cytochrome [Flavobacterium sp.]|jgi:cytochrome c|nr:c-type cytochrome [Flavobacterium sp.]
MKKIVLILILVIFTACKKENQEQGDKSDDNNSSLSQIEMGKQLFENKGNCYSCHLADKKLIGPSAQEIAKIYKEKNGNMVAFLKEEAQPIVDPTQYDIMKTNFSITEEMSDEELEALEAYIYSTIK